MRLQTLGNLRIEGTNWCRPKPLLLLAYLAVEGPKPRHLLADLFFPRAKDPYDSLYSAIRLLKQPLAQAIGTDGNQVSTSVTCDVPELLDKLKSRTFRNTTLDYPGPFLEGLDLTLGEELEEWVFGTREYVAACVRRECIFLGQEAAVNQDVAAAASWAETALTLAGAPELDIADFPVLHHLLKCGRSPLAHTLKKESHHLGIVLDDYEPTSLPQPSQSLSSLESHLPAPTTSFIGRDGELRQVTDLLARGDCRLLTIHGGGGVGKTRLALEVGRQLSANEQRVFFVALEGITTADAILKRISEAVGVLLGPEVNLLDQLAAFFREYVKAFIILDNFEHLIAGSAVISALLRRCDKIKVLVTSRERLNLTEEWVFSLEGLPVDEEVEPGSSALALFSARARSAQRTFVVDETTSHLVGKICQLVGGYPLAIELAASWTRMLPVAEIVRELEIGWAVLTSSGTASERHSSMQATFEYSFKLLGPTEKAIFRSLAVFLGPFTREAASAVSGANLFQLAHLVDKSLVVSTAHGRYTLHPLLRRFAAQKMQEAREAEKIDELYAAYYGLVLERWKEGARVPKQLDPDIHDILRILRWQHERGETRAVVEAMTALTESGSYFAARGHTADSIYLLAAAAEAAQSAGWLLEAGHLLTKLGNYHLDLHGNLSGAGEAYTRALEYARQRNDSHREAILLSLLGVVHFHQAAADADALLDEAFGLAQMKGDELALAHVLQHQGYLAGARGVWNAARQLFRGSVDASVQLMQQKSDQEAAFNLFFALCNLGEAEKELNNLDASRSVREQALQLALSQDNEVWAAHAHRDLAEVLQLMQGEQVASHYVRALELYKRQGLYTDAEEVRELLKSHGETLQTAGYL